MRSNQAGPDLLEDDGGLSSGDSEDEDDLDEDEENFVDDLEAEQPVDTLTPSSSTSSAISGSPGPINLGLPSSQIDTVTPPETPTPGAVAPTPTIPVKRTTGLIPKMKFPRRLSSKSVTPSSTSSTLPTPSSDSFPDEKKVRKASK